MNSHLARTLKLCAAAILLHLMLPSAQAEPAHVSAGIIDRRGEPRHDDANGNVEVVLSNRRREVWTRSAQCKLAKVAMSGLVGWTYAATQHSRGSWMNNELCIARSKQDRTHIHAARTFIEVWAFTDKDTHVVIRSRSAHGPSWIERFRITTGELVSECSGSNYPDKTPVWARAYLDEQDEVAR